MGQKPIQKVGTITVLLLGLTSLQVVWGWWENDRQFTRLSLLTWLFFLALLAVYYLLLHSKTNSRPLKRLHFWAYSQINGPRVLGLGLLFLGVYTVWYTHHVWGQLLIRKDLGSLFYRQLLLHQIFPHLVAYNPMLNGGYETIELLASGPVNLFLLTYPISAFFSVEAALKAQPLLLILLLPSLIYLSGRLVGFTHAQAFFSGAFVLVMTAIGHAGFMSFLYYGILPFTFSCEIAMVVFALSYRIFVLGKSEVWGLPIIVLLGSLGSFHPVFFLVMGPVALAVVLCGKIRSTQKIVYCALIGVGLLIINGGRITKLMFYNRGEVVGAFVTESIVLSGMTLNRWLAELEQNFLGFPVALVIAAVVGVVQLLRTPGEKRLLGGLLLFAILYYALLSSIGDFVLARFGPWRFVIPLSFFITLALGPAWSPVYSLWTGIEKERKAIFWGHHAALFLLTIFLCLPYFLYFAIFSTAPWTTYQLVDWLKENADKDDGRVFFYGPDHTGLVGEASFYHAKTQQSTIGVPSIKWSRKSGKLYNKSYGWIREIGECLQSTEAASGCKDLYNIRYAITFPGNGTPEDVPPPKEGGLVGFELVQTIGSIQVYENEQPSSYFLVGQGQVKQYLNQIAVMAEPSEFVVLKFFWNPRLCTDPSLVLEPYPLRDGRAFIKVQTNNQRIFDIIYQSDCRL